MLSALHQEIVEEHADQVAFFWALRNQAAQSPRYDLAALRALDDRVEAHLDGLRLGGDAAWTVAMDAISGTKKPEPGAVFVAALLAVERWDLRGLARILDLAGRRPATARAVASALGWLPFARMSGLLRGLLGGRCPPALHYLGIAASALHRQDPGAPLGSALLSGDGRLRARALRAAGELGRASALGDLRASLRAEDEAVRFAAAWSATIFGEPAAVPILEGLARGGGHFSERAAATAARRLDPVLGLDRLRALAGAGAPRAALAGVGALGDPAAVPWLLDRMDDPADARLAGGALAMITGIDLAREKLAAKRPAGFRSGPSDNPRDTDVSMDPDEALRWPDAAGVRAWWVRRAAAFRRGTRYLSGRPMEEEGWLEQVLRGGQQPARAAAAEELSMRQRGRPVFEVRAPGGRQESAMGSPGPAAPARR